MQFKRVLSGSLLLAAALSAQAGIYRCANDHTGQISFQDQPCAGREYSVAAPPPPTEIIRQPQPGLHRQDVGDVAPVTTARISEPKSSPLPHQLASATRSAWSSLITFLLLAIVGAAVLLPRKKRLRVIQEKAVAPLKAVTPAASAAQGTWSLALLKSIEWKRFEDLCAAYYQSKGIRSETTSLGPDGGIDVRLYQGEGDRATTIVQCKAWPENKVGVKLIRELLGVRVAEKAEKAFFMTCGAYTDDAIAFGAANGITLFTGEMFLMMLQRLPADESRRLLAFATEGDYTTPTCPQCGQKLVARESARGKFWGCRSYPRCKGKLGMRGA